MSISEISHESTDDQSLQVPPNQNFPTPGPSRSGSLCSIENIPDEESSSSAVVNEEVKKHIEFFHVSRDKQTLRFMRCKTCFKNQNIVKMYCENKKIPPITTEFGTRYRTSSLDGQTSIYGIKLSQRNSSRTQETFDLDSTRNTIIASLMNGIKERFIADERLNSVIEPFINFQENANVREIHKKFGADLNLSSLYLQYKELVDVKYASALHNNLFKNIKTLLRNEYVRSNFNDVIVVLSRIEVCTPELKRKKF